MKNPIYNPELWENLIKLLSDNPESPYLCDNSNEFKELWRKYYHEISEFGEQFLEATGWDADGWYCDTFFLFLRRGDENDEVEGFYEKRVEIRVNFCKYMLKLSNEYEGNQTES